MISIHTPRQQTHHDINDADRLVKQSDQSPKEAFDLLLSVLWSRMGADELFEAGDQASVGQRADQVQSGQAIGNIESSVASVPANFAVLPTGLAANLPAAVAGLGNPLQLSAQSGSESQLSAPSAIAMLSAVGKLDAEAAKGLASLMNDQAGKSQLAAQLAAALASGDQANKTQMAMQLAAALASGDQANKTQMAMQLAALTQGDGSVAVSMLSQGWLGPKAGLGLEGSDLQAEDRVGRSTAELDMQAALREALFGLPRTGVSGVSQVVDNHSSSAGDLTRTAIEGRADIVASKALVSPALQLLAPASDPAERGEAGESLQANPTNTVVADALDSGNPLISNGLAATLSPSSVPVSAIYLAQTSAPSTAAFATHNQNAGAISDAVSWLASKRGGNATLDLTPPDLGQVRLELSVDARGESARLVVHAASESARASIENALSQLHASFEATGMALSVSVDTGAASGFGQSFASQQSQQQDTGASATVSVSSSVNRQSMSVRPVSGDTQAGLSLYV
ncbi:MAG: flagellar hook-length control protein FliK [Actinobacteria bacterium]|nr:flagellar hook-length control protein FliK [Actinomycetota bacterium]